MQRSDLLRPLVFALDLQPVLTAGRFARPGGLELVHSYLDDVTLCLAGEASAVKAAVDKLRANRAEVVIQRRMGSAHFKDKCDFILVVGMASTIDLCASRRLQGHL